jgi:hypothetical protein
MTVNERLTRQSAVLHVDREIGEAEGPVQIHGSGIVRLDIEGCGRAAAVAETLEAGDQQCSAEAPAGGIRMNPDHVDLARREPGSTLSQL